MNKILVIAKREFRAAVRTKGFLISILLLPIFMGGGLVVFTLLEDKVDLTDKRIAVIDHSGLFWDRLSESADSWNKNQTLNTKGEKISPSYFFEKIDPDKIQPEKQKLILSERVRNKEIHAFVQIRSDVVLSSLWRESVIHFLLLLRISHLIM